MSPSHIIADKWSGGVSGANRKAIVEVEGSEYRNTMASFLHGLSALSLYWGWADKPGDGGALLYGRGSRPPYCTLPEAERFLRTGLDLRRLRKEILAFQQNIKVPVALVYSKASLLQVPQTGGDKTPYLFSGIRNLTLESELTPSFNVPAGETYILKLD